MTDLPPPFDVMWFRLIVGFIIGLIIGSFITMLSYRLPRHMSIIKPDSFCPTCKTALTPRDLIPIISWVMAHGTCRYCNVKISARYPLIETVSGIATMLAILVTGWSFWFLAAVLLIVFCLSLAIIQIEK
jgi:leader peptidase (prepilin peptidase)/N-methyltransferase